MDIHDRSIASSDEALIPPVYRGEVPSPDATGLSVTPAEPYYHLSGARLGRSWGATPAYPQGSDSTEPRAKTEPSLQAESGTQSNDIPGPGEFHWQPYQDLGPVEVAAEHSEEAAPLELIPGPVDEMAGGSTEADEQDAEEEALPLEAYLLPEEATEEPLEEGPSAPEEADEELPYVFFGEEPTLETSDTPAPEERSESVFAEESAAEPSEPFIPSAAELPQEGALEPVVAPAATGAPALATPDSFEELASRLERIAQQLRRERGGALASGFGSGDRFETLLAGLLAGYLAARTPESR